MLTRKKYQRIKIPSTVSFIKASLAWEDKRGMTDF